jgi:hypothetical protein
LAKKGGIGFNFRLLFVWEKSIKSLKSMPIFRIAWVERNG